MYIVLAKKLDNLVIFKKMSDEDEIHDPNESLFSAR